MKYLAILIVLIGIISCTTKQEETPVIETPKEIGVLPDWAKNANIYEVNIRQFSEEGTFNAFTADLPRLKSMNVDILWLMPIFPIGEKKRKGTLGSYYSVKDFEAVNPDHGTMDDFKKLVQTAHQNGMKVILDWVPNHSAWDNDWITEHPDWYTYDNDTITHPLDPNSGNPTGWTDVADFNYDNAAFRLAMIDALKFWVTEADVDGYRCDVAGFVPNDFWKQAITALTQVKHVFMLAEWDDEPEHFNNGFHMNYSWKFKEVIKEIAQGHKTADEVWTFYEEQETKFPEQAIHMYFITNHDENSWNNYPAILGDAEKAMAVLSHTFDGMPLIYSGQESGLKDTISFFHKDLFEWGDYQDADFYTKLNSLKHNNKALWNGVNGGKMEKIETDNLNILAFSREMDGDKVEVFINMSKETSGIEKPDLTTATYLKEGMTAAGKKVSFEPWGYGIFANTK